VAYFLLGHLVYILHQRIVHNIWKVTPRSLPNPLRTVLRSENNAFIDVVRSIWTRQDPP